MRLMISFVLTAVLMMLSTMALVEWWNGRGNSGWWMEKVFVTSIAAVLAVAVYAIAVEATAIRPLRVLAWSMIMLSGLSVIIIGVIAIME